MRDSIVFYRSFYEAIKELPPEDFKKSVSSIMEYGLNDIEPKTSGIERTIYLLAKPQIDVNNKRYQNGTKGGRKRTKEEPNNNQTITKHKPNDNVNVNDNDNDNDNDSKESVERKRFTPPSRQDVSDYCAEKGYSHVDVDRFIDFYSSKGWMVGKNKMKDWRAAVRNWARSEKATKPNNTRGNKFTNFEQRSYDYDDLERQLLGGESSENISV